MKSETHIIHFHGRFEGLYFWGQGWKDYATASKWKYFWSHYKGNFWKYFGTDGTFCDEDYLVSLHGAIYLHPMSFDGGVFGDCGCTVTYNPDGTETREYCGGLMRELNKACKECAEFCGGTFSLEASNEQEVKYEEHAFNA